MHPLHDTTSYDRPGWTVLLRLAALTAVAFALVAACTSAAPAGAKTSSAAPTADAAASKCLAKIQKGSRLVTLRESYYKYAYKKVKGKKAYKRVVVKRKRSIKVTCARPCAKTKVVKKKRVPVYKVVKRRVPLKKGNRIVKQRKKVRTYVWQKCPNIQGPSASGTPVRVTVLQGSVANLDFGAFQRQVALSGDLSGFIPGGFKLSSDNQINLTRMNVALGVTDVFIDDECNGQVSAAIRTNAASSVDLDPTKSSTSTLTASQNLTATLYTRIKLALDLRNDETGCNQPYIPTGYQLIAKTFFLKGRVDAKTGGLARLRLTSAPDPLDVEACLSKGSPTSECNGIAIPLPIIVSLDVLVNIKVG